MTDLAAALPCQVREALARLHGDISLAMRQLETGDHKAAWWTLRAMGEDTGPALVTALETAFHVERGSP